MKKSRVFVGFSLLVMSVGLVVGLSRHNTESMPGRKLSMAADLNQIVADKDSSTLSKIGLNIAESEAKDTGKTFEQVMPQLWKFQYSINKTKYYGQVAKEISAYPQTIRDLQNILIDSGQTRQRFAEKQGEARIVAMDLLLELGRLGNMNYALETQKTLNAAKLYGEHFDEQVNVDRMDLLRSIIELSGPEIMDDLESFLNSTGFAPQLAEDYSNILWMRLNSELNYPISASSRFR